MNTKNYMKIVFLGTALLLCAGCGQHHVQPPAPAGQAQQQNPPAEKSKPDFGEAVPAQNLSNSQTTPLSKATEAVPPEVTNAASPMPDLLQGKEVRSGDAPQQSSALSMFLREHILQIVRRFGYQGEITITDAFVDRVALYIRYFTEDQTGSRFFRRALVRGQSSVPMITKVFREKQLPEDLAYLALIESGYNPNARSTAGAIGMWQFMEGTARDYGLIVSGTVDERRNPEKATAAAAEHLDNLLAVFGTEDPFLGISAYNAGEGKVIGALKHLSFRERSFWALVGNGLLKSETEEYVPKLLSAIVLANSREKFGLSDEVLRQERVSNEEEIIQAKRSAPAAASKSSPQRRAAPQPAAPPQKSPAPAVLIYKVKRGDTLRRIAAAFNVPVSEIIAWNAKRREMIEPGESVKIRLDADWAPVNHTVKKGETAKEIAESYAVPPEMIALMNGPADERLKPGLVLKFYAPVKSAAIPAKSKEAPARTSTTRSRGYKVAYTVQNGSSLSEIALAFDLDVLEIRRWNGMNRSHIQTGQKLTLYLPFKPLKVTTHIVRKGETAASIAKHYKIRLGDDLLALNGLLHDSKLAPGAKLKIYKFSVSGS